MDSQNHQKYPSGSQALKKMIPQLLISVSLFSFAVSYSSLYSSLTASSSSLLYPSQKFHHYFSAASSFRLLSKNCLFLICNGLLVFLSKTSGFIQPPPSAHDLNDVLQSTVADALHAAALHRSEPIEDSGRDAAGEGGGGKSAEQVSIFIAESEEEQGEGGVDSDEEVVEKLEENQLDSAGCWLFDDDAEQLYGQPDDEDIDEDEDEDDDEDEDEDEDEGGKGEEMNTEELNRKFEDFIRRMKEEIVINEARHKVLMLN